MSKKVVIVGGVAGGATTAARLRRLDERAEIVIFERGAYISYANCGLPYHIGDVIKERESLLLQTPEEMEKKFNIDVRVNNEVLSINREKKEVEVKNLLNGKTYTETYDTLVLSTGSSPIKPPIPGIDLEGIFTLWNIPDTDAIKKFIIEKKPKHAVVIGGGFIGLEMAENLHLAGCKVSIVEMLDQVMAPVDFEMAKLLEENIEMNGAHIYLSDGVKSFESNNGIVTITLQSGKKIESELVILSIGVRPNSELAKAANLDVNERGGIVTDSYLRTSDENIYAVGDAIQVDEYVSKAMKSSEISLREKAMIPLAGPANKQGRICANNICGANEEYKGTQGTSVAKVFDMTVALTGLNEKNLKSQGLIYNEDYFTLLINQKSHAGYYPGATPLTLKLIFARDGKIYGAQIVGQDGVDKRMDTIATTIRMGGTIYDLKDLELAYAPPFSSAKDPVNMAGFVAENMLKGLVRFISYQDFEQLDLNNVIVLDVGESVEREAFSLPNSMHIPLGELRDRLHELDKSKRVIPYCAIGVRSYNAARILESNGFNHVEVYAGGTSFYKSLHYKDFVDNESVKVVSLNLNREVSTRLNEKVEVENIKAKLKVDCSGMQCPGPLLKVFETVQSINNGDIIEVSATDMGFPRDAAAWCKKTGNTMLRTERNGKEHIVYLQKGVSASVPSNKQVEAVDGTTLVVFSGDLDKALASFVIANGAAAMGKEVTMFFTFWGLNILRKPEKQNVKKPFLDSMFGAMMPRGVDKLALSKMNMGGMGTTMMKKVMKDKKVDPLQSLMDQALQNGVKLIACTMSMDVMGLTNEELIDGVDYAGVGAYLGAADESNINLFI